MLKTPMLMKNHLWEWEKEPVAGKRKKTERCFASGKSSSKKRKEVSTASHPSSSLPPVNQPSPISFLIFAPMCCFVVHDAEGPRAPAGAPTRKPFFCRRSTVLRYRMRPEPVVFLRLAFSPQLSVRTSYVNVTFFHFSCPYPPNCCARRSFILMTQPNKHPSQVKLVIEEQHAGYRAVMERNVHFRVLAAG